MELTDYLNVLRKYRVSLVAVCLAGLMLAGVLSLLTRPTYTASTSVYLSVQSGESAGELSSGALYAEMQVRAYARIVKTPIVLQPVIDRLQLGVTTAKLADKVTATVPTDTPIIDVAVASDDPQKAAAIANEIGSQLVSTVRQLSPAASNGSKSVQATVVTPATEPTSWTTPKVGQNLAIGLLLGVFVGVLQALLRDSLDTTLRNEADVAKVTDSPIFGVIGFDEEAQQTPLIAQADPRSIRAEAYRRLRTNIQFLELGGRGRTIVVTSSIPDEGKSTTAINISSILAEAGNSVLLIDADLRKPSVAKYLNLEGAVGLTTVLIGRAELVDVVQPFGDAKLQVLASGQIPPNPSELLGSNAMKQLLDEAVRKFDFVIIDSPPLLPVTDSAILAKVAGGALVVVGSGTVTRPQLHAALDSIKDVDGRILGLVLNKLHVEDAGYYRYDYYKQGPYGPESDSRIRASQRVVTRRLARGFEAVKSGSLKKDGQEAPLPE